MDEQKLTELFRSAVRDTPPASFDDRDVAAAADRITRRRRQALMGGGGVVTVVALLVGLFYGFSALGHNGGGASAGSAAFAPAQQSDTSGTRLNSGPFAQREGGSGFPSESPLQGGDSKGKVGPGADSTSQGCGPTDRELVDALASKLPSVGARVAALPAGVTCPTGTRSATVVVPGGTVTVLLVRPALTSLLGAGDLTYIQTPAASGAWAVFVLTQPTSATASDLLTIGGKIAAQF